MAERPSDLLPCPFCGSDDIRHWDAVYFETFCHDCGAAVRPQHKTPEGEAASIQAWNLCEGLRSRARTLDAAPSEPSAEHWRAALYEAREFQEWITTQQAEWIEQRAREIAREGK